MALGCTTDGKLDESRYSEPMPWIGIYVAIASAACAAAMATDIFHGLRSKKLWFPCKTFSLNATTLALMAVGTKLSADLNSSMPRHKDQLAKLSSSTFICVIMSNVMPSLGTMASPKELAMNLMALVIFVITVVVNIGIQLGTRVVYAFWEEHIVIMFVMLILLLLLLSSALAVPTTKSYFDLMYSKIYNKLAQKEGADHGRGGCCLPEKLKDELMAYWMMALTCSPQFVVGRSVTCTASGAFCLVSMVIYGEALLRSYLLPGVTIKFCSGESDYKWSTDLILVTQTVAILVGTVAPASRWLMVNDFRCLNTKNTLKVEGYWTQSLVMWKEFPLDLRKRARWVRKLAHNAKDNFLDFCILLQKVIVYTSKIVRLVSLFLVSRLLMMISIWQSDSQGACSCSSSELEDTRCYVLHLEGEEALMDCMMASNFDAAEHWIKMGKRREPKNLMTLLQNWTPAQALVELNGFDSDLVPPLDCKGEPSNCWALPVVSLTSIAIAVVFSSGTNHDLRERLLKCVQEAMVYIRFVEEKLDQDGSLTTLRKAAQIVWVRVDLHYKWLDLNLRKMGKKGEEETPRIILKSLSAEAKRRYIEYKNKDAAAIFLAESPSKWPPKILAANSMYRICQSLLQLLPLEGAENQDWQSSNKIMFERLSNMIAGIVGACLTNLPHVICTLCHQSSMEEREKSVRLATMLLGKAGKILELLSYKPLTSGSSVCSTRLTHIDDWRALRKQMDNQWHCNSRRSQTHKNKAPAGCSSDLYLTVE